MHSKGGYKICICLVILGELEAFQNYKDFMQFYFPEHFRVNCIERFTKVRIFLFPLSIKFLNPKILGSLCLRKLVKHR